MNARQFIVCSTSGAKMVTRFDLYNFILLQDDQREDGMFRFPWTNYREKICEWECTTLKYRKRKWHFDIKPFMKLAKCQLCISHCEIIHSHSYMFKYNVTKAKTLKYWAWRDNPWIYFQNNLNKYLGIYKWHKRFVQSHPLHLWKRKTQTMLY